MLSFAPFCLLDVRMPKKVSDYLLKLQIKVQKCFTNLHTYVLIK
jgi:hypothetical protein